MFAFLWLVWKMTKLLCDGNADDRNVFLKNLIIMHYGDFVCRGKQLALKRENETGRNLSGS